MNNYNRQRGSYGGGYGGRNRGNWRDGVSYNYDNGFGDYGYDDDFNNFYNDNLDRYDRPSYGRRGANWDDNNSPREFTPRERAQIERAGRGRRGGDYDSWDDDFDFLGGGPVGDSYYGMEGGGGDYFSRGRERGSFGRRGGGYGRGEDSYYGGRGQGSYYDDYPMYYDNNRRERSGRGRVGEWGNLIRGSMNRQGSYYDDYPMDYDDRQGRFGRGRAGEWGNLIGGAVNRSFNSVTNRNRRRY